MTKIPGSGTDLERSISYQNCCVLAKILEEWKNEEFRFIIIEDPKNEIEDINCVYQSKIEFIQIKKKDAGLWTKSLLFPIIKSFNNIYLNPKGKLTNLNLKPERDYSLFFQFITDGSPNPDLNNFITVLQKVRNRELLEKEEKNCFNLFFTEKEFNNHEEYEDFITKIDLIFRYKPSSNLETSSQEIEQYCITKISELLNCPKELSESIFLDLIHKISTKGEGKTVGHRTLRRKHIKGVTFQHKAKNKDLRDVLKSDIQNFPELESFIKVLEEYSDLLEDEIDLNYEFTSEINYMIPISFKIKETRYFVIPMRKKITESRLRLLVELQCAVLEKNIKPIFIYQDEIDDYRELIPKYVCANSRNKEAIKNYFEGLLND